MGHKRTGNSAKTWLTWLCNSIRGFSWTIFNSSQQVFFSLSLFFFARSLNVDVLKDRQWHQVCVLWSSITDAWSIYLDGRREKYGIYNDFVARGLRKLRLGRPRSRNQLLMTQVNLWNRILTNQEITDFAKICSKGVGDLVSWADIYDKTKEAKDKYITSSSCKAAPQFLSTTAAPATTASTTTQAVTTSAPQKRPLKHSGRKSIVKDWFGWEIFSWEQMAAYHHDYSNILKEFSSSQWSGRAVACFQW